MRGSSRFLFLLALLLAPCWARAQAENVEVSFTYTAVTGAGSASVTIEGFPDLLPLTKAGTDFQESDVKIIHMPVDETIDLLVTATNIDEFRITTKVPTQFGTIIKGVRRSTIVSKPFTDGGTQTIRLTLVRDRERGPGDTLPVGHAGSISWGSPRTHHGSQSPQGPYMLFNLGSGLSGEPLPQLRIPLRYHGPDADEINVPDSPEITTVGTPGLAFQFNAPQAKVSLTPVTPNGNYTLTFTAPDSEAPVGPKSPFVTYSFEWQNSPRQVKVTKAVTGGLTYETLIKGSFSQTTMNNWTIEDWHVVGLSPLRYVVGSLSEVPYQGPTPLWGQFWPPDVATYNIEVRETENGSAVTHTQYVYHRYTVQLEYATYLDYVYLDKVIEGPTDGNYITRYPQHPSAAGVSGVFLPGGKSRLEYDKVFTTVNGLNTFLYGKTIYETWLNTSPSFTTNPSASISATGAVTEVKYETDLRWFDYNWPKDIEKKYGSTVLAKTLITYSDSGPGAQTVTETRSDYPSVNGTPVVSIEKRYRPDHTYAHLRDKPLYRQAAGGAAQSYLYQNGSYSGTGWTADFRIITLDGAATGGNSVTHIDGVAVEPLRMHEKRSTKTIEYLLNGRLRRREVWVYTGGTETGATYNATDPVSWENREYTLDGRLKTISSSSGGSYSATWVGTRKTLEKDETQLERSSPTPAAFDAMDRPLYVIEEGITGRAARRISTAYDADNRVRYRRVGPDNGQQLVEETVYDLGGRVKEIKKPSPSSDTEAGTNVTKITYPNGGRDVSETFNFGTTAVSTKVTTRKADGRVESIVGTGVVHEHYSYSLDGGVLQVTKYRGALNKRPETTYYDLLGNVTQKKTNGFGVGGSYYTISTFFEYENGELTKRYKIEGNTDRHLTADWLYYYDAFGEIASEGLDVTVGGGLTANSLDRFETTTRSFEQVGGSWYQRVAKKRYYADNSTSTNDSYVDTRLTGLGTAISEIVEEDYYGNKVTTRTEVSGKARRILAKQPTGTTHERLVARDDLMAEKWYPDTDPTATGTPTISKAYTYDAQGRVTSMTDGALGTDSTSYWYGTDLVKMKKDARATETASYTYDPARRIDTVTRPAGSVSYTYTVRGELEKETGIGTYPTLRSYTIYGELWKLSTYRSGPTGTADVTEWTYDDNTGMVSAKKDADGKSVTYEQTYSNGYDETKEYLARAPKANNGTPIVRRSSLVTGDLKSITYPAPSTADVTFLSYDRTGRPTQIQDVTGVRTIAYDKEQILTETLSSWYGSRVLTAEYQASNSTSSNSVKGRLSKWQLGTSTVADNELAITYSYDDNSRIDGVTADYKEQVGTRPALNVVGKYTYRPNSLHWKKFAQSRASTGDFTIERFFETNRDVIHTITTTHPVEQTVSTYGYNIDTDFRRTWATQAGVAFGDVTPATFYKYSYSTTRYRELTGAKNYRGTNVESLTDPMPGRDFYYAYDTAGNRTGAGVTGASGSRGYYSAVDIYSGVSGGNALNQPRSRLTISPRVSGSASPAATVTVDNAATTRSGRYWDFSIGGFACHVSPEIKASTSIGEEIGTRQILIRSEVEAMTYDADGNMVEDGAWIYVWDGANRLTSMYTRQAVLNWNSPPPKRELFFSYDYLGRRVSKLAMRNGVVEYNRKYIYVGHQLLAEIDATSGAVVQSYAWGLDVDGSLSGAGGVGGLVLQTLHTPTKLTAYHIGYDAQGNVTTAVNRSTDKIAAAFEYGPYGEVVRRQVWEGDLDQGGFPFRYSTKFTDAETSLVYFGFRYYEPSLGRFLSRDPIGEQGGVNLYAYVSNNPVNRWDYLGMAEGPIDYMMMGESLKNYRAPGGELSIQYTGKNVGLNFKFAGMEFGIGVNEIVTDRERAFRSTGPTTASQGVRSHLETTFSASFFYAQWNVATLKYSYYLPTQADQYGRTGGSKYEFKSFKLNKWPDKWWEVSIKSDGDLKKKGDWKAVTLISASHPALNSEETALLGFASPAGGLALMYKEPASPPPTPTVHIGPLVVLPPLPKKED